MIVVPHGAWMDRAAQWEARFDETYQSHLHPRFANEIGTDLCILVADCPEDHEPKFDRLPNLMPVFFTAVSMEDLHEHLPLDEWGEAVENWPN